MSPVAPRGAGPQRSRRVRDGNPYRVDRDVRLAIVESLATALKRPVDTVSETASFASMGVDSLIAAELAAAVEDATGIAVDAAAIYEHPSVDELAAFLEERAVDGADVRSARSRRLEAMRRDAMLPADVRPGPIASTAEETLLTGATGFVGAHLLRALLDAGTGAVICLVRGSGGRHRIESAMQRFGVQTDGVADRVRVVDGDLERPQLGLDSTTYMSLVRVGNLYHVAAAVDWVQAYDGLRAANVDGTLELLRMAATGERSAFHFVSSLAVCYSTTGDRADETLDPMTALEGMHLGYAHSKSVAESLVRQAAGRGLEARIIRPALVTGHGATGVSNPDDLVALLLRGCIALGAAPDMDWTLDCVPVDHVARAVVALGPPRAGGGDVVHLRNGGSRRWRECVLWMRLRGYPLDLLPYADWAALVRDRATAPSHPLFALRGFLLRRIPDRPDAHLAEMYEDDRHPVISARPLAPSVAEAAPCEPLGPALLERYFRFYEDAGAVPRPACSSRRAEMRDPLDALRDAVERATGSRPLTLAPMSGDDSIVAELTSWRTGAATGLFRARLEDGRRVVVKSKPSDEQVMDVAEHVAALASPMLGALHREHRSRSPFRTGHVRELALARIDDRRWARHTAAYVGSDADPGRATWTLVVEEVTDALPATGATHIWAPELIETAIDGIATLHSVWLGRVAGLDDTIPVVPRDQASMIEMRPLWRELARRVAPSFRTWAGDALPRLHARLAASIGDWWIAATDNERTLIHNDCNSRNVLLRRGDPPALCALDWELATIGAPQRDLAELLAFTLDPTTPPAMVIDTIERGRSALERESGRAIDARRWTDGFVVSMGDLLVDRLASYAMLHRFRPQPFLPRVVRTWLAIYRAVS
jgi:thioester reductase-like protein